MRLKKSDEFKINYILDNFDFEKAEKTCVTADRTCFITKTHLTSEDLKNFATSALMECYNYTYKDGKIVRRGPFRAIKESSGGLLLLLVCMEAKVE